MLELKQVHTYYGQSHILRGLSLHIDRGECVALLGPNGMGKTTTLRTVMGLTPALKGSVIFKGQDITHLQPFRIARLGIGYVPEERGLFDTLTVLQNLMVPFLNLKQHGNKKWEEIENKLFSLFPILKERHSQLAGSLSGGEQQMLATAQALISGEEMVLMDEPTEGLAPMVVENLIDAFRSIKQQGITMMLVESNIRTAVKVADRCYIMEKGYIKLEESMKVLSQRSDLLHQYLGVTNEAADK